VSIEAERRNRWTGTSVADRFWPKVKQRGECWRWTGRLMSNGYGRYGAKLAHRMSYEMMVTEIPEGLHLDHLCRNRWCVNPGHLDPVTQKVNNQREKDTRTHCPHGHEYSEKNTHFSPKGWRACRTCARERQRISVD